MFRSITGFLFGCEEPTSNHRPGDVIEDLDSETGNFLDPNDWVFVEDDYRPGFSCEKENEFILKENFSDMEAEDFSFIRSNSAADSYSAEHSDFDRLCGPYVDMRDLDPQYDSALSEVSSQPELLYNPSIEECWIVSPSPCFTGQDALAERLRSSSMEDLLIEHPSMSIYRLRGRRPLRDAMNESRSPRSDASADERAPLERNCGSMGNLRSQGNEQLIYNNRRMQSPYWTSDSETSSVDVSSSRADLSSSRVDLSSSRVDLSSSRVDSRSSNITAGSERRNPEMDESSDSVNSGRENAHRRSNSRAQMRVSHGNLERSNKAFQQQAKKKRKFRRVGFSAFNCPNGKKRNS